MTADSTTATTISLSWTSGGSEGVSYEVDWQRVTTGECPDVDEGSATLVGGSMTSYTVTGVQEDSNHTITVTASNSIGDEVSEPITGETMTAGEVLETLTTIVIVVADNHSSICPSLFCDGDWYNLNHHHCPVGASAMYPPEWSHHWLLSEICSDGEQCGGNRRCHGI